MAGPGSHNTLMKTCNYFFLLIIIEKIMELQMESLSKCYEWMFRFYLQISSWSRKAVTCGFHLLPVPGDPFALPSAADSDPLRGPIFVSLNIKSVAEQSGSSPFPGKFRCTCR